MKSGITVQGTNPMAIQKLQESVMGIINSVNSDQVKLAALEVMQSVDLAPNDIHIDSCVIGDNHDDTHS